MEGGGEPDFVRINMEGESLPQNVVVLAEEMMRLAHAISRIVKPMASQVIKLTTVSLGNVLIFRQ